MIKVIITLAVKGNGRGHRFDDVIKMINTLYVINIHKREDSFCSLIRTLLSDWIECICGGF